MSDYFRKTITKVLIAVFVGSSLYIPKAQAGEMVMPIMPKPGTMVNLSPGFTPAHLQGITIHTDNALKFDFIIDRGDGNLTEEQKQIEYKKLVKYFLASLAVPDEDQWVNLSPYEKDRIIKDNFGQTEMGRDLLSQDYLLKQLTASLIYPEKGLGKEFWDQVYAKAQAEYGTTNIPVDTFNKVWIMPDDATVYEHGNTAFVLKNHLKVMLEEDYLALQKNELSPTLSLTKRGGQSDPPSLFSKRGLGGVASDIVRDIILPAIEKEVNEGKNFAMLRQVYSGMILSAWYKRALKESLLGKVYANKSKVQGIDQDPKNNEVIYQKYLRAFKKGAFNYIKEDVDQLTKQAIPRKYFSGGTVGITDQALIVVVDAAMAIRPLELAAQRGPDAARIILHPTADAAMGDISSVDSGRSRLILPRGDPAVVAKLNEMFVRGGFPARASVLDDGRTAVNFAMSANKIVIGIVIGLILLFVGSIGGHVEYAINVLPNAIEDAIKDFAKLYPKMNPADDGDPPAGKDRAMGNRANAIPYANLPLVKGGHRIVPPPGWSKDIIFEDFYSFVRTNYLDENLHVKIRVFNKYSNFGSARIDLVRGVLADLRKAGIIVTINILYDTISSAEQQSGGSLTIRPVDPGGLNGWIQPKPSLGAIDGDPGDRAMSYSRWLGVIVMDAIGISLGIMYVLTSIPELIYNSRTSEVEEILRYYSSPFEVSEQMIQRRMGYPTDILVDLLGRSDKGFLVRKFSPEAFNQLVQVLSVAQLTPGNFAGLESLLLEPANIHGPVEQRNRLAAWEVLLQQSNNTRYGKLGEVGRKVLSSEIPGIEILKARVKGDLPDSAQISPGGIDMNSANNEPDAAMTLEELSGKIEVIRPIEKQIKAFVFDWDGVIQDNVANLEREILFLKNIIFGPRASGDQMQIIRDYKRIHHANTRDQYEWVIKQRENYGLGKLALSEEEGFNLYKTAFEKMVVGTYEEMRYDWREKSPLIGNIERLLEILREKKIRMDVATNLLQTAHDFRVRMMGLMDYFEVQYGSESGQLGPKEDVKLGALNRAYDAINDGTIRKEQVAILEDNAHNIGLAVRNGFTAVGIAKDGVHAVELREAGANIIIHRDYRNLIEIMEAFKIPVEDLALVNLPARTPLIHGAFEGDPAQISPGGIDMNSANLVMTIKRDGKGVPLPLAQQDMTQLSRIQGFIPVIIEIKPALTLPIFSELKSIKPSLASVS